MPQIESQQHNHTPEMNYLTTNPCLLHLETYTIQITLSGGPDSPFRTPWPCHSHPFLWTAPSLSHVVRDQSRTDSLLLTPPFPPVFFFPSLSACLTCLNYGHANLTKLHCNYILPHPPLNAMYTIHLYINAMDLPWIALPET